MTAAMADNAAAMSQKVVEPAKKCALRESLGLEDEMKRISVF